MGSVLVAGLLFSGCHKDGLEPSVALEEATLRVRFDLHCDGQPFNSDSVYTDGFGTRVRFERMHFALLGLHLTGDQGQPMGDRPDAVLMVDQDPAECVGMLNGPSSGDTHWIDTRTVVNSDGHAGLDSLWVTDGEGGFLAALDVSGRFDSNDDGLVDESDAPFRIVAAVDASAPDLHIHAHGYIAADGTGLLDLPVNVRALLHDIDIPDVPITIGAGPYATQALYNLRHHVLGADNQPI